MDIFFLIQLAIEASVANIIFVKYDKTNIIFYFNISMIHGDNQTNKQANIYFAYRVQG